MGHFTICQKILGLTLLSQSIVVRFYLAYFWSIGSHEIIAAWLWISNTNQILFFFCFFLNMRINIYHRSMFESLYIDIRHVLLHPSYLTWLASQLRLTKVKEDHSTQARKSLDITKFSNILFQYIGGYTVFHAAGWSSNLQGIKLNSLKVKEFTSRNYIYISDEILFIYIDFG